MKSCITILFCLACCTSLSAAPPEQAPDQEKPDQEKPGQTLGELKVETPLTLEKTVSKEDVWNEARYGVIGQFIQAPNPFSPINPFTGAKAGFGESNLNKDTVTGRPMGLAFLKIEF